MSSPTRWTLFEFHLLKLNKILLFCTRINEHASTRSRDKRNNRFFSFFFCVFLFESEDDRWSSLPRSKPTTKPAAVSTSIAANNQNCMHLYAQPSTSRQFHSNAPPLLTSFSSSAGNIGAVSKAPKISQFEGDKFKNSPHSSSRESNNSHSDHSGGSGATLPLDDCNGDDPIDYADA